jgi:hypothetical protein
LPLPTRQKCKEGSLHFVYADLLVYSGLELALNQWIALQPPEGNSYRQLGEWGVFQSHAGKDRANCTIDCATDNWYHCRDLTVNTPLG